MRPPPIFWVFNSPSPRPPGADGSHRGTGHVGRHCPYTNNIWCGSVHALLRYRSKTAKMQKFPIDSHSNENFICLFFRPPGAANPQKGRRHVPTQAMPACKIWRESARGLLRNRWPNKQKNIQTYKHTVKQIPRPSLYERMAGNKTENSSCLLVLNFLKRLPSFLPRDVLPKRGLCRGTSVRLQADIVMKRLNMSDFSASDIHALVFTAWCDASAVFAVKQCLSVTFVDHVKTNKDIFEIFHYRIATPF